MPLSFVSLASSGPQPGWDPDIVAALEAAECSETVDDQLEDDFVTMVRGDPCLQYCTACTGVYYYCPNNNIILHFLFRLMAVRLVFLSMSQNSLSELLWIAFLTLKIIKISWTKDILFISSTAISLF